jgi:hypothetical protein
MKKLTMTDRQGNGTTASEKRSYKYRCREAVCSAEISDKRWIRNCSTSHKFKSIRHEPIKREIVQFRVCNGPWPPHNSPGVVENTNGIKAVGPSVLGEVARPAMTRDEAAYLVRRARELVASESMESFVTRMSGEFLHWPVELLCGIFDGCRPTTSSSEIICVDE